jgi:hypothetical protein
LLHRVNVFFLETYDIDGHHHKEEKEYDQRNHWINLNVIDGFGVFFDEFEHAVFYFLVV